MHQKRIIKRGCYALLKGSVLLIAAFFLLLHTTVPHHVDTDGEICFSAPFLFEGGTDCCEEIGLHPHASQEDHHEAGDCLVEITDVHPSSKTLNKEEQMLSKERACHLEAYLLQQKAVEESVLLLKDRFWHRLNAVDPICEYLLFSSGLRAPPFCA